MNNALLDGMSSVQKLFNSPAYDVLKEGHSLANEMLGKHSQSLKAMESVTNVIPQSIIQSIKGVSEVTNISKGLSNSLDIFSKAAGKQLPLY